VKFHISKQVLCVKVRNILNATHIYQFVKRSIFAFLFNLVEATLGRKDLVNGFFYAVSHYRKHERSEQQNEPTSKHLVS